MMRVGWYEQEVGEAENRGAFAETELRLAKEGGKPKEFYFASDASAVVEHTKKVMVIEDNEVVHLRVSTHPFHPDFSTHRFHDMVWQAHILICIAGTALMAGATSCMLVGYP
jgi:hypothetical protein